MVTIYAVNFTPKDLLFAELGIPFLGIEGFLGVCSLFPSAAISNIVRKPGRFGGDALLMPKARTLLVVRQYCDVEWASFVAACRNVTAERVRLWDSTAGIV